MISFIIPTLNEEKVLAKTIDCIQKYKGEKEIIVSDGKSSDKTIEIARAHGAKVVEYKGETRQTIAAGRNSGAAIAKGNYIVFLDADDYFLDADSFFSTAVKKFDADPGLVAFTVAIKVFPEMQTTGDFLVFGYLNRLHFILNNIFGIGVSAGEFQMMRVTAYKKLGGLNEKLVAGEDYEFFNRLSKIGKTKCMLDMVVYHTGRRAHKVGWPKLLSTWFLNAFSVFFLKHSAVDEWEEIR